MDHIQEVAEEESPQKQEGGYMVEQERNPDQVEYDQQYNQQYHPDEAQQYQKQMDVENQVPNHMDNAQLEKLLQNYIKEPKKRKGKKKVVKRKVPTRVVKTRLNRSSER